MNTPAETSDFETVVVTGCRSLAKDIFEISLQKKDQSLFSFDPGQYAFLQFGEHDVRPYSIASSPEMDTIQFHVKDMGHGLSHALSQLSDGTEVLIDYPHGSATYQKNDRPILAIGGGLGLAPLIPIIRAALQNNPDHHIHLYHGAEEKDDLYLHAPLTQLADHYDNFAYTAVTEIPSNIGETGIVGQVATRSSGDLSGFDAYISGAPAMVVHTAEHLEEKGLKREHIFTDAPL